MKDTKIMYSVARSAPACQAKFRLWLRRRYQNIDQLNLRWHTSFWGRTLMDQCLLRGIASVKAGDVIVAMQKK